MKENKDMFSLIREPDFFAKEFSLEELGLEPIIVKKLSDDLFIRNLGQLLEKDVYFIDEVLDKIGFVTRDFKTELRHFIHKRRFVLKNEFSHLGISDEFAMVPVWELRLRANTSNALLKKDIYVLGDLISLTSKELSKLLPKEDMVKEVIMKLSDLGLCLQEEAVNKKR